MDIIAPLTANVCTTYHETFYAIACVIQVVPAISLGNWFCVSRKSGTGGGGEVHPKGEDWLQKFFSRDISIILGANEPENSCLS